MYFSYNFNTYSSNIIKTCKVDQIKIKIIMGQDGTYLRKTSISMLRKWKLGKWKQNIHHYLSRNFYVHSKDWQFLTKILPLQMIIWRSWYMKDFFIFQKITIIGPTERLSENKIFIIILKYYFSLKRGQLLF